jgi:hypothetical protein
VVLGAIAGYMVASSTGASGFKTFEGIVVGAVLFPIGWVIGRTFGRICQPSVVFGREAVQLGVKKVGYSVMPLGFAIVGGLASLYEVAKIIHDDPSPTVASSAAPSQPAAAKHPKHHKKAGTAPGVDAADPATAQSDPAAASASW